MTSSSTKENISDFKNFENSIFNPFDTQQILRITNSTYFSFEEIVSSSTKTLSSGLSKFYVNIRSLNKNFEKLKDFLSGLKDKLSVIALTNTWFSDDKAEKIPSCKDKTKIRQRQRFLPANSQL